MRINALNITLGFTANNNSIMSYRMKSMPTRFQNVIGTFQEASRFGVKRCLLRWAIRLCGDIMGTRPHRKYHVELPKDPRMSPCQHSPNGLPA